MSSLASLVATYVVNALWQIPLLAAAGWLASRMLAPLGPRAQHLVWVATLLLSIAVPAVPIALILATVLGFVSSAAAHVSLAIAVTGENAGNHDGGFALPARLLWMVFAAYSCTAVFFAGRLAWLLAQTSALVRKSQPALLSDSAAAAWEHCRRAFDTGNPALLVSPGLRGAVTVGARRPVILFSAGFVGQSTEHEFLSAMGHECAHIRRRDALKNLLYEAASVVTAFHPVTWMVKAQIAQTREMICDAMVVERLVDRQSYTRSLLHLAERMLAAGAVSVHAIGMFDANVLEKRIMQMKATKQTMHGAARWALTVSGALLLSTAAATGGFLNTSIQAQAQSDAAQDQGKVYPLGKDITSPVLTYAPDPEFPKGDKSKGGVCVVGLIVDAQGMPKDVHIERSLAPGFDANSLAVVRQYRFKPAQRKGQPVAVRIHIEVNYKRY
jgi:TonB family protein